MHGGAPRRVLPWTVQLELAAEDYREHTRTLAGQSDRQRRRKSRRSERMWCEIEKGEAMGITGVLTLDASLGS